MTVRKQLRWDDNTDIWPITDASAVHYTYNPSQGTRIISPSSGTSYGLDQFLNGLGDRFMSKDEVVGIATNMNKSAGVLFNSAANTTAVAAPSAGTSNAFVKCSYTSAGVLSLAFDTTTYLPSTTKYALSGSVGGNAKLADAVAGGAKGKILYQSAVGTTAFLGTGSAGQVVGWDATNAIPTWVSAENYTTTTIAAANYSLSSGSWTTVSTALPTTSGTYALYIDDGTNGSYAGIFAIEGGAKEKLEEIPLHWATAATTTADSKRVYAAISSGKLQLASTDATATTYNLTIKYKRII